MAVNQKRLPTTIELERVEVLREREDREDGAEEGLEVGVERAAPGAGAIDGGEPEEVADDDRAEAAVEQAAPRERGRCRPRLRHQPRDRDQPEQQAADDAARRVDLQRRVALHRRDDADGVDGEAERGREREQDPDGVDAAAAAGGDERHAGEGDRRREPVPRVEAFVTREVRHQRHERRQRAEHERNRRRRDEVERVAERDLVQHHARDRRERDARSVTPSDPQRVTAKRREQAERRARRHPSQRRVDERVHAVRDAVARGREVEAPQEDRAEEEGLGRDVPRTRRSRQAARLEGGRHRAADHASPSPRAVCATRGRVRHVLRAACVLLLAVAAASTAARPKLAVVASGLDNPRKLVVGAGGALYVAEAGSGGADKCFGTGANAICVGRSGGVARIVNGRRTRVVSGLVSWANAAGERALGPAAVLTGRGSFDVLLDDDAVKPNGTNALGPDGRTAGDLVSVRPGRAPVVVADFAAFEAAHNPDHGAGPGAKLGNPPIDSDPYAMVRYRGGFAVADAGANDLLWVSPAGKISVLAVFPTQTEKLTPAMAKTLGAPATRRTIPVQSVPSSVAVGPDGAVYVGELTARPFISGIARVWRVVPGRRPAVYASGFTNISDVAFDGRNLLVLEIADHGLYDAKSTGALIRVAPSGARTVLASDGLIDPTGLAVDHGSIFVSNYGVFPSKGPGPHGEVVKLSPSR